jgi:tRNA dimethylallyltransferase
VCAFLSDQTKLIEAVEEVKRDTRAYAKRQMTWFKRDQRIVWVKPGESVDELVDAFLNNKPTP